MRQDIVALIAPIALGMPTAFNYTELEENTVMLMLPVKLDNTQLIENKLFTFKALRDNWDGYGAPAIDELVITNSLKFIEQLPEFVKDAIDHNEITPTSYGTVVIDWRNINSELVSVEIGERTIGFFSKFHDGQNYTVESVDFNENSIPQELFQSFHKLYSN